jgi:hypothetical protein
MWDLFYSKSSFLATTKLSKKYQEELTQPPVGGSSRGYGQAGEQGRFPDVDPEAVLGQEQAGAVNKARLFSRGGVFGHLSHRGLDGPVFGELDLPPAFW